ncbi:MAG TPA: ribbon-helix-helix domain-containing protein [Xanthobacteraceae bacterium]|nr:ribbon-helix-helix domain-containing protein [Xanthobacteraceae bacterium]
MQSTVVKRSIVVSGHKTSVSLEDAFWEALKKIAASRDMTLTEVVAVIDAAREHANLSSAIRLYILEFYREQLATQSTPPDGSIDPTGEAQDRRSSGGESGSFARSLA